MQNSSKARVKRIAAYIWASLPMALIAASLIYVYAFSMPHYHEPSGSYALEGLGDMLLIFVVLFLAAVLSIPTVIFSAYMLKHSHPQSEDRKCGIICLSLSFAALTLPWLFFSWPF